MTVKNNIVLVHHQAFVFSSSGTMLKARLSKNENHGQEKFLKCPFCEVRLELLGDDLEPNEVHKHLGEY